MGPGGYMGSMTQHVKASEVAWMSYGWQRRVTTGGEELRVHVDGTLESLG